MKRLLLISLTVFLHVCMLPFLINANVRQDITCGYHTYQPELPTQKNFTSYSLPKTHWPSSSPLFMDNKQISGQVIFKHPTFNNIQTGQTKSLIMHKTPKAIQHSYGFGYTNENKTYTSKKIKSTFLSQNTSFFCGRLPIKNIKISAPAAINAPALYTHSSNTLAHIASNNDDDDDWTPTGNNDGFDNPGQPGTEYLQPTGTELYLLLFIFIYLIIKILKNNYLWRNLSKTKP